MVLDSWRSKTKRAFKKAVHKSVNANPDPWQRTADEPDRDHVKTGCIPYSKSRNSPKQPAPRSSSAAAAGASTSTDSKKPKIWQHPKPTPKPRRPLDPNRPQSVADWQQDEGNKREEMRYRVRTRLEARGLARLAKANSPEALPGLLRILGVPLTAGSVAPAEVEKAFKRAQIQFHPDRSRGKGLEGELQAEETFKLLQAAYQTWTKYNAPSIANGTVPGPAKPAPVPRPASAPPAPSSASSSAPSSASMPASVAAAAASSSTPSVAPQATVNPLSKQYSEREAAAKAAAREALASDSPPSPEVVRKAHTFTGGFPSNRSASVENLSQMAADMSQHVDKDASTEQLQRHVKHAARAHIRSLLDLHLHNTSGAGGAANLKEVIPSEGSLAEWSTLASLMRGLQVPAPADEHWSRTLQAVTTCMLQYCHLARTAPLLFSLAEPCRCRGSKTIVLGRRVAACVVCTNLLARVGPDLPSADPGPCCAPASFPELRLEGDDWLLWPYINRQAASTRRSEDATDADDTDVSDDDSADDVGLPVPAAFEQMRASLDRPTPSPTSGHDERPAAGSPGSPVGSHPIPATEPSTPEARGSHPARGGGAGEGSSAASSPTASSPGAAAVVPVSSPVGAQLGATERALLDDLARRPASATAKAGKGSGGKVGGREALVAFGRTVKLSKAEAPKPKVGMKRVAKEVQEPSKPSASTPREPRDGQAGAHHSREPNQNDARTSASDQTDSPMSRAELQDSGEDNVQMWGEDGSLVSQSMARLKATLQSPGKGSSPGQDAGDQAEPKGAPLEGSNTLARPSSIHLDLAMGDGGAENEVAHAPDKVAGSPGVVGGIVTGLWGMLGRK